jgi:hypothetical protein
MSSGEFGDPELNVEVGGEFDDDVCFLESRFGVKKATQAAQLHLKIRLRKLVNLFNENFEI